jgi:hypothetical protein
MPSTELKKYTELSAQMNPDDVQPINTMINAALKNLGGRPATYPFTEAGLNSLVQNSLSYFDYVEKANSQIDDTKRQLILDVDSYATYLGISKKTLSEYQKRNETWDKTISLFKDAIGSSKKQLALHGLIPSVMAVFDLANNHGYINTSEFKLTTNDISDKTARADYDLESRIEEAGLVWDNDLKEYVPKED